MDTRAIPVRLPKRPDPRLLWLALCAASAGLIWVGICLAAMFGTFAGVPVGAAGAGVGYLAFKEDQK